MKLKNPLKLNRNINSLYRIRYGALVHSDNYVNHIKGWATYRDKEYNLRYIDTNNKIEEEFGRPCRKCGRYSYPGKEENGFWIEDYDSCLGQLPNVKHACCGHGISDGYILFENGIRLTLKKL